MDLHMKVICISLVACLILAIIALITKKPFFEFTCAFSGLVLVISYLMLLIGTIILNTQDWIYDKEPWYTEKIVSMSDTNMLSGRFYLRRGYLDEELYYQYMEELKNGGYQADKVKASITTIYYDNENPRVDWYKKRKKWLWFETDEPFYKMYVPEGTIADDFTIDLQ